MTDFDNIYALIAKANKELGAVYNQGDALQIFDDGDVSNELMLWERELETVGILLDHLRDPKNLLPYCLRESPLEYARENGYEIQSEDD